MSGAQNYTAKSPYCNHELDPANAVEGWVTCECGKRSDARWVRELGWLQARTSFVNDRVTAGDAWYDTNAGSKPLPSETSKAKTQIGEQLLYILGGLSIFVAVGVFAAVSWETLGAFGQAAVLVLLALISGVGAVLVREKLSGLAGTLAVLSTVVLGVMFFAAPQFGLLDESLLSEESWYTATVILGLGLFSAIAGWQSRILGWILILPFALLIAIPMFIQMVVPDYIDLSGIDFFNPVFYTLVIMALNRYEWLLERSDLSSSVTRISAFIAQAVLAFISLVSLQTIQTGSRPWLLGISLALVAAMYGHLAYRWRLESGLNIDSVVSVFVTPAIAALAFSYFLSPPSMTSLRYADELALMIGGAFAAFVFLYPAFVEVPKSWSQSLSIGAVALWLIHFFRVGTDINIDFGGNSAYVLSAYFGLIAAAALGQWNKTRQILAYLLGVGAGVIAIIISVSIGGFGNNDPEYVTFPAAIWLAVMIWVLRRQAASEMNSGIWLGIPLGMALIPSAAIAVTELDMGYQIETIDWVRFWVALSAGLAFTVLGTSRRVTGLLIPGAITYVLVVFPQLAVDLGLFIPRWVLFLVFGGLLISVAARYERLQKLRDETGSWRKVFR